MVPAGWIGPSGLFHLRSFHFPTAHLRDYIPALFDPCSDYRIVMRHPDRAELKFSMLLFMVVAPMAYYTIRGMFALFG